MAVAWIGSREAPVEEAAELAAKFLQDSRCPVFSFDADVNGSRALIALAERVGASYDHLDGVGLSREVGMITDRGGMVIAPGEVRRRADLIIVVGTVPEIHHDYIRGLADTRPDLSGNVERSFYALGAATDQDAALTSHLKAVPLSCGDADLPSTIAAVRALRAGRPVSQQVSNSEAFLASLAQAKFPVFVFSGLSCDHMGLEMLQALVVDINQKQRASALHLPTSDRGWGSVLASTWMTGFALRTGFARDMPDFDPWRHDVARMIEAGEADLHLWLNAGDKRSPDAPKGEMKLIAISTDGAAIEGADITFAIGKSGVDHPGVTFSSRVGTLISVNAEQASDRASAADILRLIGNKIEVGAEMPC